MFKLFKIKKPKFFTPYLRSKFAGSTPLFVVAALAAFILLGSVLFFIRINLSWPEVVADKYYLKTPVENDPLITQAPNLEDILAGPIISQNDPSLGPLMAPAVMVEFSDYQCGFCQEQEKNIKSIINKYSDKVRLIWKDYPENSPNSISFKAAQAARCAGNYNKYWEYHDLLYQEKNLSDEMFLKIAQRLNLNESEFKTCLSDNIISQKIKNNMAEADALGITGIPFIFINQQEIMGQTTLEELEKIIKIELKIDAQ